jgi:hypothetical protein
VLRRASRQWSSNEGLVENRDGRGRARLCKDAMGDATGERPRGRKHHAPPPLPHRLPRANPIVDVTPASIEHICRLDLASLGGLTHDPSTNLRFGRTYVRPPPLPGALFLLPPKMASATSAPVAGGESTRVLDVTFYGDFASGSDVRVGGLRASLSRYRVPCAFSRSHPQARDDVPRCCPHVTHAHPPLALQICGSVPELGSWKVESAPKLTRESVTGRYVARIPIPCECRPALAP